MGTAAARVATTVEADISRPQAGTHVADKDYELTNAAPADDHITAPSEIATAADLSKSILEHAHTSAYAQANLTVDQVLGLFD